MCSQGSEFKSTAKSSTYLVLPDIFCTDEQRSTILQFVFFLKVKARSYVLYIHVILQFIFYFIQLGDSNKGLSHFYFTPPEHYTEWVYQNSFRQHSTDEHLGCSQSRHYEHCCKENYSYIGPIYMHDYSFIIHKSVITD